MNRRMLIVCALSIGTCALAGGPLAAQETPAAEQADAKPAGIFPDPALEAAVRAEVYAKRNNQEPLTAEDVKDVSRVVGIDKGIESLEGLQHCGSLRLIRLSDNKISDLKPLAGLKLLQSIELNNNQITDISALAELTAVQLLDVSGNQLKNIDVVAKMTNMRTLWLADNQIESLAPLTGLGKVGSLDLAGNGLPDAALEPIGKMGWITHLDLDRNKLTSLAALQPLKKLSMVLARENQIKDLGPLVEMCKQDMAGEKRFAPYLELYIRGNPLDEEATKSQLDQLREMGVEVVLE